MKNNQLGDIESSYALFHAAYTANELNRSLQPFQVETNAQNSESTQIRERLNLLQQQIFCNNKKTLMKLSCNCRKMI